MNHTLEKQGVEIPNACYLASQDSYVFNFYSSIEKIASIWDMHCGPDIFLKSEYLNVVEKYPPKDFSFFYCLITKSDKVKGVVYYQSRPLELDKNFQEHEHGFSFLQRIRKWFLGLLRHQLLINGNVLLTGPYGSHFTHEIDTKEKYSLLTYAHQLLIKQYNSKATGLKIRTTLIKDQKSEALQYSGKDYTSFDVDPSMILSINPDWTSFNDYRSDIKSKYKVRYKSATKKVKSLVFRELDLEDVKRYNSRMFELFKFVQSQADFNLFELNADYFHQLHEFLGNKMHTKAFFKDDEMIGFYTIIENENTTDAHFLGYDLAVNKKYKLYQNMLYKMVEDAIMLKSDSLNFSRTALEIKSTIGAEPKMLSLATKHEGKIINRTLPFFLNLIVPKKEWTQRKPFKDVTPL